MAVVYRKDGRWSVVYSANGKQKWEYFGKGISGEKKAKERNLELKNKGKIGKYNRQSDQVKTPTFSVVAEAYLEAKSLELPKNSVDNIYYQLTGTILPELGDTPVTRINPERIRHYIKKRIQSPVCKRVGPEGKKLVPIKNEDGSIRTISKSTVHRELSDIIAIMNWGVSEGYIIKNPLDKFKKPARDDEIIQPPTLNETNKILDHSAEHLKRALIIAFYTGLRPGASELFNICWNDVNLEENLILIISAQKGGPRSRLIPLHPEFKEMLEMWWTEDENNGNLDKPLILWKGLPVKSVKKAFNAAKRRAGITRRLRMYDFRHAFATAMLKQGADLKSTSEMLGHSRTDTTSRIYQHTDIEMHRQNIAKLPGLGMSLTKG